MPKKTKHCPVKAFWGMGKDDDANTPVIINAQADNPYLREYASRWCPPIARARASCPKTPSWRSICASPPRRLTLTCLSWMCI